MIDLNLILNFLIAIFLYNIILKAFGAVVLKWLLSGEKAEEVKKTFKEKLKEKLKETKNETP